jgi:RNA polymerase sigma factor (sigma-70 family)
VEVTPLPTTLDVQTQASLLLAARDPANQEARAAFAERYTGLIRDWCRRSGIREADQDDVLQTILCRFFEMLPTFQYDPSRRFRGLLRTMVHHAIVDLHRERQRHPGVHGSGDSGVLSQLQKVPAPDDASVESLVGELTGQMERDQRAHEACQRVRQRVGPKTWQAFWLTTIESRSAADVAQQLEMKKGAVIVYKHRVIKMIQLEVEGTLAGEEGGAHRLGRS